MIYADNAATTKMSEKALETMVSLIKDTYGNPSSLYEFGQKSREVLEDARAKVAKAIGANPKEIMTTRRYLVPQRQERQQERNILFLRLLNTMRYYIL